ncbi:hypothetical protein [Brachybacterium sp. AOP3-A1-3]|uniref:hypothetical protein n=1 Tax=Brachybacterium sp. AOP3-A1-3 TaxID=3457699 RepID=UPI0040345525
MSTTGFEKRIAAEAPDLSRGQVKKLAARLARRAADMQEEFDFYECLRILGMTSDTTARDAIRSMEAAA